MKKSSFNKLVPYLFVSATFIILFLVMYLSVLVAFTTSMTDKVAHPYKETHWVWYENIKTMMTDE